MSALMVLLTRSIAALAVAGALAGCSPVTPPAGSAGSGTQPSPANVVDWARGPTQAAPEPRTGDRLQLVVLPKGQPIERGRRAHPECVAVKAVRPAPAPDPRIFFLDDRNVVQVRLAPGAKLTGLDGYDAALGVQYLLGFDRLASPLELLVGARPHGADRLQLWKLAVAGRTLVSQREVTGAPAFATMDAFFAAYSTPRCLEGGRDCLVPSHVSQQWFLELEAVPLGLQKPLQPLGDTPVTDVVWAVPGESMYLLVPC
jgi:hypothetical protein